MLHARAVLDLADALDGEIEQTGGTAAARRRRAARWSTCSPPWSRPASRSTPTTSRRSRRTSRARCATPPARRFRVIGKEINLGSPKQLQVVLFDELGDAQDQAHQDRLHDRRRRPAGALREDRAPVPDGTCCATATSAGCARPSRGCSRRSQSDGRIHTTFNQTIAATGRLSSTDPNLQNIPIRTEEGRRIREGFVVGKGFDCLMTADYSQIEMRIMAHLSEDALLIEAFQSGQRLPLDHRLAGLRRPRRRGDRRAAGQDQGDELRPRLRPVRVRPRPAAAASTRARRAG